MSDFIEFRHLRYILAIAESGNITRAAEHLFLAQPSLSKQIKDLEEEIGDPIFERTRDGVRPTIVGQVLIDYAKKALLERKAVLEITKTIHRVRETPLRLGFSSFINPRLLEQFRLSYAGLFPQCQLQLKGGEQESILQDLEEQILDCALLCMPIVGAWSIYPLARSPLMVCVRTDDPLAHEASISLQMLAPRLGVFQNPKAHPPAHARLLQMFSEAGLSVNIRCTASTPIEMQWMVKQGCGLALIDQDQSVDAELTTRPLDGVNWTSDIVFLHRANADHPALPNITRLIEQSPCKPVNKAAESHNSHTPKQLQLLM